MNRVLILDAGMGAGHRVVAKELARRLIERGFHARRVDVLDLLPSGLGGAVRGFYRAAVSYTPWLYDGIYAAFFRSEHGPESTPLAALAASRLRETVDEYRPDVIVPVFHLAAQITGRMRARGELSVPTAVMITDFAVHRQWLHPGNDVFLCVSADSAEQVRARIGRPAYAPGPVVPQRFHKAATAEDSRWAKVLRQVGDDRIPVLISTGSWGVARGLPQTAEALHRNGYLPVVLCGRDERGQSRMARLPGVLACGWVEDIDTLMVAAGALIDNAAGQTAVQALAAGLPVIGYRPIAGHGREGVLRMAQLGVTNHAASQTELLDSLARLTTPGEARDEQIRAGRALFVGDAAEEIRRLAGTATAQEQTSEAAVHKR
jgi:UDP-N-acetylglucosamine:LPS N-acetylglucosamine transferase